MEQSDCGYFYAQILRNDMKQSNSKEVKRAIFEELSNCPRFTHILETVIGMFKQGQDPVVIESWNTYWQRFSPTDEMWKRFVPDDKIAAFQSTLLSEKAHLECKATLNVKLDQPFREAIVTLHVTENNKRTSVVKCATKVPDDMMSELVSWGYRDKNYLKLFFKSLGYGVSEGNVANKHGLLITLE